MVTFGSVMGSLNCLHLKDFQAISENFEKFGSVT